MSFEKQVKQFRDKTVDKIDNIYRASIRDVIDASTQEQPSVKQTGGSFEVGKIPVDSSQLAESLFLKINGNIRMHVRNTFRREVDKVKATDKVSYGWTAPHGPKIEYGDGKVAGRFFATNGARKWRTFVNNAAAKFKGG